MKKMIFGTIMLVLGMVCASGDTIANGIMACVFMGVAAIVLRSAESRRSARNEELRVKNEEFATAA